MQSGWFSKLNNILTWRKPVNLDVWALLESRLHDRVSSACLLQQLADTNLQKNKNKSEMSNGPHAENSHIVSHHAFAVLKGLKRHPSKMLNVTKCHFALEIRAFSWQPTMDWCSAVTVTNKGSVALNTSAHPGLSRESPGRNHFLFHDTASNDRLCSWRLVARISNESFMNTFHIAGGCL